MRHHHSVHTIQAITQARAGLATAAPRRMIAIGAKNQTHRAGVSGVFEPFGILGSQFERNHCGLPRLGLLSACIAVNRQHEQILQHRKRHRFLVAREGTEARGTLPGQMREHIHPVPGLNESVHARGLVDFHAQCAVTRPQALHKPCHRSHGRELANHDRLTWLQRCRKYPTLETGGLENRAFGHRFAGPVHRAPVEPPERAPLVEGVPGNHNRSGADFAFALQPGLKPVLQTKPSPEEEGKARSGHGKTSARPCASVRNTPCCARISRGHRPIVRARPTRL